MAYVPIVFGFPSPEMMEEAERGEIIIGGCCVGEEVPTHACSVCSRSVLVDGFEET